MATAPMSRATLREWIDPDKPRFFPITDPAVADAPPSDAAHSDIEFTRPDEGEEDVAPPPPPPESGKKVSFEEELALLAEMSAKLDTADSLDKLPADASQDRIYQRALDRRRFLRARKHDVNAAVEMYIKCLEWRRDNGIDTILDNPDPLEAAYQCNCSHRHFGFDREGHPVYWERTGHVRVGEMLKSVTEEDVVRRHVRMMEYALRRCQFSSQRLGRNVEKIIMIQDLTNLSYAPEAAALRIFRQTCRVDQDYYPERLQRMILINAPLSFRGIWAIIRPWVDPKTASKVLILGTNFHEQLREIVDPSQTPAEFGGECHIIFKNGDGAMPLLRSYPDPNSTPAAFDLLKKPSDDEDSGRYLTEEEIAAKIEAEQAAAAAKKGGGMFGFFRRS